MTLTSAAAAEKAPAVPLQPIDSNQNQNKRPRRASSRRGAASTPTPPLKPQAEAEAAAAMDATSSPATNPNPASPPQQPPPVSASTTEPEAPAADVGADAAAPAACTSSMDEETEAAEPEAEEAQMCALFFNDEETMDGGEAMDGGYKYQYRPSARRVAEDKGEWRLLCSSDEEGGYGSGSDLSSDDDGSGYDGEGGRRRKRAKKRRPLRVGLRTIGQMQAALDADPAWRGLGVLARFLREGSRFDEGVGAAEEQGQVQGAEGAAPAAMDVVVEEEAATATATAGDQQEAAAPSSAPAPAPAPTASLAATDGPATATAPAPMEEQAPAEEEAAAPQHEQQQAGEAAAEAKQPDEEAEEDEAMDPVAAAEARAAMAWHLRARPMCPPFKEEEMAAIQERARVLEANKKPPLEERRPPPYKKVRRMVFHESMKDRAGIFREDGQDAQCECVDEEETAGATAASEQQPQPPQAASTKKKGRGRPRKEEAAAAEQQQPTAPQAKTQAKAEAEAEGEADAGHDDGNGVLCGPGCINRSLHVECTAATCRFAQEGRCRNQQIAKREGKAFEVFRTDCRGWGVRAAGDIRPGSYIMEYVGEVIDEEEVARRMEAAKQSGAENYYMVELQGVTVDARDYGNEARFVNHSCEPNCSLQKWLVDGSYHLALFSIKPIKQGQELTWDYNFASFGEPKPCLCGAPTCRKILSGKPLREEAPQPQLTAKGQQTQREAAAAEAFRRRLVGKPLGDISDFVLFFNGRTSKGEMAQARDRRLWLTTDGPAAGGGGKSTNAGATGRRPRQTLGQAVEAARARVMAMAAAAAAHQQEGEDDGMAKIVAELDEMAAARATAQQGDRALSRPCRRLGLLSLRDRRLAEAAVMPFAQTLLGEARVAGWPEPRRAAMEDMVVFMRTSETAGLLTDLNEDVCYNCSCSGDLLCCDACSAAFHLSCAGLWQLPEEDTWLCNRCKKGAERSKRDAVQRERATGARA